MLPFIKVTIFVLVLLLCFVFYSISFPINSAKLSLHLSFHFVFDCSVVAFSSIIIYVFFLYFQHFSLLSSEFFFPSFPRFSFSESRDFKLLSLAIALSRLFRFRITLLCVSFLISLTFLPPFPYLKFCSIFIFPFPLPLN